MRSGNGANHAVRLVEKVIAVAQRLLCVFANVEAAEKWFEENDPEGVAFEYEVLE
jgi:hypothetical protein